MPAYKRELKQETEHPASKRTSEFHDIRNVPKHWRIIAKPALHDLHEISPPCPNPLAWAKLAIFYIKDMSEFRTSVGRFGNLFSIAILLWRLYIYMLLHIMALRFITGHQTSPPYMVRCLGPWYRHRDFFSGFLSALFTFFCTTILICSSKSSNWCFFHWFVPNKISNWCFFHFVVM